MYASHSSCVLLTMVVVIGASGSMTANFAKPPSVAAPARASRVEPLRWAPARVVNGQLEIGAWGEYVRPVGGSSEGMCFDAFEPDGTDLGAPMDTECGMGAARWYFGPDYCSGMAVKGFYADEWCLDNPGDITRLLMAWWWQVGGAGTGEQCVIAFLTGEDFEAGGACSGFGGAFSGNVYDFGLLESSATTDAYYYVNIGFGAESGIERPATNPGWYQMRFLTDDGLSPATCAQPMLWGTDEPNGEDRPGRLSATQYDDDNPRDGVIDVERECYDYAMGRCPDPLGAMMGYYVRGESDCTPRVRVKATCKGGGDGERTVVAKVVKARPGVALTVQLDPEQGPYKEIAINSRGKGKAKFAGVAPGEHGVAACEASATTLCP